MVSLIIFALRYRHILTAMSPHTLLRILRNHLSATIFVAAAIVLSVLAGCHDMGEDSADKANYGNLISRPVRELVDSGGSLMRHGKTDSAYVMYSAAMNLYSRKLPLEERRMCEMAYNNAGHISTIHQHNYSQAYSYLLKALEIAEETDYEQAYPYIWANLGNLMCYTGNWEEGMEYQVRSIDAALAASDTSMYLKGIVNLATEVMMRLKTSEYGRPILDFPKIKAPGEFADYAGKLCEAARHQMAGRFDEAEKCLLGLESLEGGGISEQDRLRCFRKYIIAVQRRHTGRYGDAIGMLHSVIADTLCSSELRSYVYEDLALCHKASGRLDSAAVWKLRHVELKDSLLSDKVQRSMYDMKRDYEQKSLRFRMAALVQERKALVRTIWIVSVFSAAVLLLLVLVIISWRNMARAKKDLFAANQELLAEIERHRTAVGRPVAATASDEAAAVSDASRNPEVVHRTEEDMPAADPELETDIETVRSIFENSPEIYTPDFSIERMASIAGITVRRVSRAVNTGMSLNFSSVLQTYRIREACRRLSNPGEEYANYTIEAIAESVGFRSRSNFNSIFKKIIGLTPSTYQKMADKKRQ